MSKPLFRWGILGAAQIARKNWQAIRNTGNGQVVAVAGRAPDRARQFIAECQASAPFPTPPRVEPSYESLIEAGDVDGLYIPLPTGVRKEWVIRAARAGKHVVSEKPCGTSLADLAEMLATCRRHRVQFMDGVMFMHSARLEAMRQVLADGETVGPIRQIHSTFSFRGGDEFFSTNIRGRSDLEPLGCLGDLGWYCIRFTLWAMGWKLPTSVRGSLLATRPSQIGGAPIPMDYSGEMLFPGGGVAGFYCSFVTALQQTATIAGTRGYLGVRDFVLPFHGCEVGFDTWQSDQRIQGCDFSMEPRRRHWSVAEYSHSHPTSQETNLFRKFAEQAQSGTLNESWPEAVYQTQQVLQACLESAAGNGVPIDLLPHSSPR